jgi:hypothetical protein
MKTINIGKDFDCLKMKTDIQTEILLETDGMNDTELLHYFNTAFDYIKWQRNLWKDKTNDEIYTMAVEFEKSQKG